MHVLSAALRIPSSPHLKLKVIWGNPNQHPLPPNLCHSKSMDFSGKSFLFHPAGGWTQLSVCTSKLYDGHNYFLNSVTNVILVVRGLRGCAGSLELWRVGTTLDCSARASHCGGVFSCCRAQALGQAGFSTCGSWAQ